MANLKRVLWHLLGGTRGGPLRIQILLRLLDRPYNTNQLASDLGHDYKTIQHHLRVLKRNRILDEQGTGQYGSVFFPTKDFEDSIAEFRAIARRVAPHLRPGDIDP
jgi:DNA-binding transcriptional ArsR family regulator